MPCVKEGIYRRGTMKKKLNFKRKITLIEVEKRLFFIHKFL